jgi:hypothetical protein
MLFFHHQCGRQRAGPGGIDTVYIYLLILFVEQKYLVRQAFLFYKWHNGLIHF